MTNHSNAESGGKSENQGPASPAPSGEKNAEDWGGANPGDPGPPIPEPRKPVDPSEDPRLPVNDVPRGV